MEFIILVSCEEIPIDVREYISDEYDYECHYDHTVLQVEDNGNLFAEWLKARGYKFKSKSTDHPSWDLIALYGT